MGTADMPAAHMNRGGIHSRIAQPLHKIAHGSHICQGVQGAYLVEVDFLDAHSMDGALRLGNAVVDGMDIVLNGLGYLEMGYPVLQLLHTAVGVMMLVAVMVVLRCALLGVSHIDVDMGAGDAALLGQLPGIPHSGYPQRIQFLYHFLRLGEKLQQSGGEHVTGSAHAAV